MTPRSRSDALRGSIERLVLLALCSGPFAGCQERATARPVQGAGTVTTPGTLVPSGMMERARAAHTATNLRDGRVLLVGGLTGEANAVAGAALYDPASGSVVPTGPMRTARHSHTATRLSNGKVLVTGGNDARGSYLSSAELYDPTTGTFAAVGSAGTARAGHAAVLLPEGRVLLAGGVGEGWSFLSSAEVYDPATATFTPTGAMRMPRESHVAVSLQDGRVLIVGGHAGRSAALRIYASAEIYEPTTGRFRAAGNMAVRRHKHDAVLLTDGRVLITGGADERDSRGVYQSAELYDPGTETFVPAGEMRLARYKHQGTSVVLPDGLVLLCGGAAQAEVYDSRTGIFTLIGGEARMAGQFSASALLADGSVLISGGYGVEVVPQRATWLYRP